VPKFARIIIHSQFFQLTTFNSYINYIMANAMLVVNFVSNKLGRVRLELNGYQYMVKNNRGDRRYWKCIVLLCPATVNTHYKTVTKSANYHTHFRTNRHRPWHTNSSYSQTTATQIKFSCLLQLATSPTLYQHTSSMETALPTLHQLNLLNSTHCNAMVDDVMYPLVFGL
jgi:hypothetical protein